jgi:uncharacterized protein YndB with AHSA1/START domain
VFSKYKHDPKLDLVLERTIDLPVELVWEAWTTPEHIKEWFCPKPWGVTECEIDLRPGGIFRTVMRSPEGEEFPGTGSFLEVTENQRLIWTSALLPGYRPAKDSNSGAGMPFTGVIEMERAGNGSIYRAIAVHKDEEDCEKHSKMGFHEGWGIALDQLVAHMKKKH